MRPPPRTWNSAAGTVLSVVLMALIACTAAPTTGTPGGAEVVPSSPIPVPSATPTGPPTAVVRRGTIADIVSATGRVTDVGETALSFQSAVRVANVNVDVGQTVDEGQVLVEADVAAIETDLSGAQTRQDQARGRVESARAVIDTRLQRAEADLERITAPPPLSAQLAAEAALAAARADLRKVEADLAALTAPRTTSTDIVAVDREIVAADLAVRVAESSLQQLRRGADPAEVRQAESSLLSAEIAHTKALDSYRILVKGPDPYDVRAAERAVTEAQDGLRVAQQVRPLPPVSTGGSNGDSRAVRERAQQEAQNQRIQYEAGVRRAENLLETARDRLAKLTQGPSRADVEAAVRAVERAKRDVDDARERLAKLREGTSRLEIEAAEAEVASARTNLTRAQDRREALNAGPPGEQVSAAQANLETARLSVATAQARYTELTGPQRLESDEVRTTQARIDLLRQILESQPEGLDVLAANVRRDDRDLADAIQAYRDAQRGLADETRRVSALQASLDSSRLMAPFPGVVTGILTQPGESSRPGRPVMLVARGEEPVVRAEVSQSDAARLAVGQEATVETADHPGVRLPATVSNIIGVEGSPSIVLTPIWDGNRSPFGTSTQVAVTIQRKADVLIVPQRAVRVVGTRRFVDILEGATPRRVEVEVGITSGGDVEISGPLTEGQHVLVAP